MTPEEFVAKVTEVVEGRGDPVTRFSWVAELVKQYKSDAAPAPAPPEPVVPEPATPPARRSSRRRNAVPEGGDAE